ncbi:MAG: hypothetical protein Q9186_007378 [Xanthomendoza sp. 1 TL-2023]
MSSSSTNRTPSGPKVFDPSNLAASNPEASNPSNLVASGSEVFHSSNLVASGPEEYNLNQPAASGSGFATQTGLADDHIHSIDRKRAHPPDVESSSVIEADSVSRSADTNSQYLPQFDPLEEEQVADDSASSDSDVDMSSNDEQQIEVPALILDLKTNVHHISQHEATQPHQRYIDFLHRLCHSTGTATREDDCIRCFPHLLSDICTFDMSKSFADNQEMDLFALAITIYEWLLICKKRGQGTAPERHQYLYRNWAAYFLSACEFVKIEGIDADSLASAVPYWEDRGFEKMGRYFGSRTHWLQTVVPDDPDLPSYRNQEAQGYLDTLQHDHIEGLTRKLIKLEIELQQSDMKERPDHATWCDTQIMMASINPDLLTAIIEGQVERKAEIPGSSVSKALLKLDFHKQLPPSIYQNAICDREGNSPTPFQWSKVHNLMQDYLSDTEEGNELAVRVDQIIHPSEAFPLPKTSAAKRLRRYTDFDSTTGKRSSEPCLLRREFLSDFTKELNKRLGAEVASGGLHVPLVAPVVQVGFSSDVRRRLRDHRKHERSNYIMNLAQALFEDQYPEMFCLKQHIIFHCFCIDQPWSSEILLTRLAQGYFSNGGGFSPHGPGASKGGAWRRVSYRQWAKFSKRINSDREFQARLDGIEQRGLEANAKEEEEAWALRVLQKVDECLDAIIHFERVSRNYR